MAGHVAEFTDQNFEEQVLKSQQPVLVDFWAPWCAPCRQIAPLIEQLATENGDVRVGKVNIDDSPRYAEQYRVQAIPTIMVFKGGQPFKTVVGMRTKSQLQALLDEAKA